MFDLTAHDSYFTILVEIFTNRILAENTYFANHIEWTEHKITILKPANKYQLTWECHSFKRSLIDFPTSSFSLSSKSFVNIIFYRSKNKVKRRDSWPFKYLLSIWFTLVPKRYFVKLCNTRKFGLSCSIEMYYFEELP